MRTGIIMTLALAMLLATPFMTAASRANDDFIVGQTKMRDMKRLDPLIVIALDNGDEVVFTPMPDKRGRSADVLVSEVRSEGRVATRSVEGLDDANPLELFNALAPKDTMTPALLIDLYGDRSQLREQGWARDMAIATGPTYASCPATYWIDQMDHYSGIFGDNDPFESTWDGPNTKPSHWGGASNAPADGKVYYDLHGQANDVTAFYGAVLYCVEDYDNASTWNGVYVGNYVTSHFRVAGTGTWYYSYQLQLSDVGDIFEHIYNPGNKFSPSATKYDFHIEIETAKPADQFHIGATWVYGGPTDIKLGS